MNLYETIDLAKKAQPDKRPTVLDDKTTVDDLMCEYVTELLIVHSYEAELPDLSLFPNLTSFSCTNPVTMDYIVRQDLSKLKKLRISFNNCEGAITINASSLELLGISIHNNYPEEIQLDAFACQDNYIQLSDMPYLKQIEFRYCTGHRIILADDYSSVEKAVFVNQDGTDFSILSKFPLLKELTISGCNCRDVNFLRSIKTLRRIDLSYNCLSDISPLLVLNHLEHLDVHHTPITEATDFVQRGCEVVITLEDVSFQRFKWDLNRLPYETLCYADRCRIPNSAKPEREQRFYDSKTNDELFAWCFNRKVNRLIDDYSINAEQRLRHMVSRDRLIDCVLERYPFVEISAGEVSNNGKL